MQICPPTRGTTRKVEPHAGVGVSDQADQSPLAGLPAAPHAGPYGKARVPG
jgi:hypothetical protein